MNDVNFPTHVDIVVIDEVQLAAVYALLGGNALSGLAAALPPSAFKAAPVSVASASADPTAATEFPDEPTGEGTVDAGGHPWSEALHASTKGTTKDGYWRMKVGVSRPADLPGFPKAGASASGTGAAASSTAEAAPVGGQSAADEGEDDEFAAFRAAAAASDAKDGAAAAAVPARKWTDADLSALCNQAAQKLGSPDKVKAAIAKFVPAGEVAHSRNVPADQREAFAKEVETGADITFAG